MMEALSTSEMLTNYYKTALYIISKDSFLFTLLYKMVFSQNLANLIEKWKIFIDDVMFTSECVI